MLKCALDTNIDRLVNNAKNMVITQTILIIGVY